MQAKRRIEKIFGGTGLPAPMTNYEYTVQSDTEQEFTLPVIPTTAFIFLNGTLQEKEKYEIVDNKLTMVDPLLQGDTIFCVLDTPIVNGNRSQMRSMVVKAEGGETEISVPFRFTDAFVTVAGLAKAPPYDVEKSVRKIVFKQPLVKDQIVYILFLNDNVEKTDNLTTLESIAYAYKISDKEVCYSTDKGISLDPIKVINDVNTGLNFLIPQFNGKTLVSFNDGVLVTNDDTIDVVQYNVNKCNLIPQYQLDFEKGFTLRSKMFSVFFNGKPYRWAGNFPKVVPPNSTIESTGGEEDNTWISMAGSPVKPEKIHAEVFPVGIVVFFGQNKNPNSIWPTTKWVYTGASKYIRIGAADGSDVGKTGGSNTFTISKANLPNTALTISGSTSSFDYGSKGTSSAGNQSVNTSSAGAHTHTTGIPKSRSGSGAAQALMYQSFDEGVLNVVSSSSGAHTHSVPVAAHTHSVTIGAHVHTVSGNTEAMGSGNAITFTPEFINLMAWMRTE